MAAKTQQPEIGLVDSFAEFKEFKNIDRATMMHVLEDVFKSMLRKKFESEDNFDIIINTESGDLEIYHNRLIVDNGEVENENTQISITDALKLEDDYELGEEAIQPVYLADFGRRNILAARQMLITKILELEKDEIFNLYKDKVGEIISGEVYQIWKRELLVLDDEGTELILPKNRYDSF